VPSTSSLPSWPMDLKWSENRKLVTTCYHQIVSICWELSTCFNRKLSMIQFWDCNDEICTPWTWKKLVMRMEIQELNGTSFYSLWLWEIWTIYIDILWYVHLDQGDPRRNNSEAPTQWPRRGEHHPLTSKLPPVPCNVLADAVDILSCPIQTSNLAWYHYQWL
jgi:hypothetical protein